MYVIFFVVILCLIPNPVEPKQDWLLKRYSDIATCRQLAGRVINLTKSTYHDASLRITEINHIRFLYQKTPQFEQGYVFSEIMERYKKMVEQYKKVSQFGSQAITDAYDRVEHTQKLYFEIYHFVMMFHEINRKYQGVKGHEDAMMTVEEKEKRKKAEQELRKQQELRDAEVKLMLLAEQQKKEKKLGGAALYFAGKKTKEDYEKNPYKRNYTFGKYFPIDYGWDPLKFDF